MERPSFNGITPSNGVLAAAILTLAMLLGSCAHVQAVGSGWPLPTLSAIDGAEEDSRITSVVLHNIMSDPVLSQRRIDVRTRDQIVTLSGELGRPEERGKILKVVSDVGGVRRIEDRLRVRRRGGTPAISDDLIAAKVQEILLGDVLLSDQSIRVESEGGVVTLRGRVDRTEQSDRAVVLARAVEGVRGVVNLLQVRG